MSDQPALVLYYREGCHLCEEMAALLYRGWPAVLEGLEWVDVDRSAELAHRYGQRVPVLMRGDDEICALAPDARRLISVFGEPANPV